MINRQAIKIITTIKNSYQTAEFAGTIGVPLADIRRALYGAEKALMKEPEQPIFTVEEAIDEIDRMVGEVEDEWGEDPELREATRMAIEALKKAPADGEWQHINGGEKLRCSICGYITQDTSNFCPECGSDMGMLRHDCV